MSVFEGLTGNINDALDARYLAGGAGSVAPVQAASFNASANTYYPIDSTASVTVVLPAAPSFVGEEVSVQVVAGPSTNSLLTNPVTVNGNGHVFKALGGSTTATLQQVSQGMVFTWTGSVWRVQDSISLTQEILRSNGTYAQLAEAARGWSIVPPALHILDAAIAKRALTPCNVVFLGDSLVEGRNASTYRKSLVPVTQDTMRGRWPTVGQGGSGQSGGLGYIAAAWPMAGGTGPQDCIPTTTGTATPITGATSNLGLGRRQLQLAPAATCIFPAVIYTGFDIIYSAPVTSGVTLGWAEDGGSVTSVAITAPRSTLISLSNIGDVTIAVGVEPEWIPGTQLAIDSGGNLETAYILTTGVNTVTLTAPLTIAHAMGVTVGGNGNGGYIAQVRGRTRASHVVTISNNNGSGNIAIEGIRFYDGDEAVGIHLLNAGHGGIRADQYLSTGATDHWSQSVVAMLPSAIVCDLLINDSGAQSPATVVSNMTALRLRINNECVARGLPIPSWIQAMPYAIYGFGGGMTTNRFGGATWQAYVDALIQWAATDTTGPGGQSGIHLVDLYRRMPDSSNTSLGYYDPDQVHPIDAGEVAFASFLVNGLPVAAA